MNKPFQHLYTARWSRASRLFLIENPLCVYCLKLGKTTPAQVTDHIKPHKGNINLFWDKNNWQPLCKQCHDSAKAVQESKGYLPGAGADGLPVDSNHPWNKD